MKKWEIKQKIHENSPVPDIAGICAILLQNRGISGEADTEEFLNPKDPIKLNAGDVGIDETQLEMAIQRIRKAIDTRESIVVYADYDADGITAGTIMWETLHTLGANAMPYIPHRVDEGYGLSVKGIDSIVEQYHPGLIVTVDHGITAYEKVAYAKSLGIDVIVTDHHTKPDRIPDCTIIHTTRLCGAGVSWFVAKELSRKKNPELVALAAIGTVADLVQLTGANRSITKYGLSALNTTGRIGLNALLDEAGLTRGTLSTFDVSHVLAPRLNAMGRLEHAMDALRLLCTGQEDKAMLLARKLGLTNKERQQMTIDTALHARQAVESAREKGELKKILFVAESSYNQGIIGLVAGKLVEEYYLPAIVLAKGDLISKASARSIAGFNIVEAIKHCSDILIDVGGHPMAAGFTVETKNLPELQKRLEQMAENELNEETLQRILRIDLEMPLSYVCNELWSGMSGFAPFGYGNPEPVFASEHVSIADSRTVGADGKHLKLKVRQGSTVIDAIAFGLGSLKGELKPEKPVSIAYSIDMNVWNGRKSLQLKVKDIRTD